jgi:hypothetical protein
MTNYTPGPWEKTPYKQEITAQVGDEKRIIAMVWTHDNAFTHAVPSPVAEANARLVEKAPDMEKLLREVTEFLYILDAAFEPGNLEYNLREEIDTLRQYIHEGTP